MELKKLAKTLELEQDDFLELVYLFVKTSSSDLNKLKSAIEDGDSQKVAGFAHSIRGAAVTLGFTDIFEYAKKMETNAGVNDLNGATGVVKSIEEEIDRIARGLHKEIKSKN
jgi:HPt (histidine-containing phosphotransfer) domain-containing protein